MQSVAKSNLNSASKPVRQKSAPWAVPFFRPANDIKRNPQQHLANAIRFLILNLV